jgi:hypothetical protein
MRTAQSNRLFKTSLRVFCIALGLATSSAWAAFVTWDLNPNNLNQPVGSASQDYTVSGSTITAHGYDNNGGVGTPHELFFRFDPNEDDEHGLGLVGTLHNELQADANGMALNFIQLNLSSILAQGFTNGQISVGSVQPGELFNFYGSHTLGALGTLLNPTPFGHDDENQFVSIPDFGTYEFISVVAAALDVLPAAFRADLVPIPEASSLIPALLLATSAILLEIRRRRHAIV